MSAKHLVMDFSSNYRPGDPVPETGVYRVYHHAHRLAHSVIICKGGKFPKCARCGALVSFAHVADINAIERDRDFEDTTAAA